MQTRTPTTQFFVLSGTLREIKGVVELDGQTRAMINTEDAASNGISDGDEIEVITQTSASEAVAQVCENVPAGFMQLSIPHTDTLVQSLNRAPVGGRAPEWVAG